MTTPTPTGAIPPIFVSHAHTDNAFCRLFVVYLRAALGVADPNHIFYDERSLDVADPLLDRLGREVVARPIFIVILSPHSVDRPYVRAETTLALQEEIHHAERRTIGVIIEPCDPGRLAPMLTTKVLVDVTRRDYEDQYARMLAAIRTGHFDPPPPVEDAPRAPTPAAPDSRLVRARELAGEAREALTQNIVPAAIAKAESALERFATYGDQVTPTERADVFMTLADACGRAGQWQRALDAAKQGRDADPDRLALYLFQAAAQRELNQPAEAQQTLDKAWVAVGQNDIPQRLQLLAAQRALDTQQGQWQRALTTLDEEQRLAPGNSALANMRLDLLGRWRAQLYGAQAWDRALSVLDQELALARDDPARLGARLDLLQRAGQTQPALALARQLTGQSGATAVEWLARARLARQVAGDGDAADPEIAAALDAAARLAPADPAIAQARKDLFPPPIPPDRFPARFADLGFTPRKLTHAGKPVELILPPLCAVPAGPFWMGSDPRQDKDAYPDEQPQREVSVAAFQIARFQVTVAEYACYQRALGKPAPTDKLDHPVVNVSWRDAVAYAAWLAQLTGQPWRLPTEAEWEKAARYDPTTRASRIYPWGDTFDQARCNTSGSGRGGTTPVDSYPGGASPCGAQDMAGNVWEWTSSLWKGYPYDASDGRERADSTDNRVLRGGSWCSYPRNARAASRGHSVPGSIYDFNGFRVARSLAPS